MLTSIGVFGQEYALIPYPTKVNTKNETPFQLNASCTIYFSEDLVINEANYLQSVINSATGLNIPIKPLTTKRIESGIVLNLVKTIDTSKESYSLDVSKAIITINASESHGVFNGIQTLLQLFPAEIYSDIKVSNIAWEVPAIHIIDQPKFEWRGMHLDVARNFKSVSFVKKFIDLLAYHKLNIFHWHLTEDQGWRIEIKKYPKLTEIGAWRDSTLIGHMRDKPRQYKIERTGGFYTQEQIKDVVKYAQDRHITIVPEIEMPGHAQAAIAAYPEYGNTGNSPGVRPMWGISHDIFNPEEKTIAFLKEVLNEVIALFPGDYIHIGGDEAKKTQWESSERVQQLLKKRGLTNMHEMQSWFIEQINNHLIAKGKQLIGWDEILEGGLPKGATVMSWRGDKGGIAAAKKGHKAVMANNKYTYFNRYQSQDKENEPFAHGGFISLEKAYTFNPIPEQLSATEVKFIIGAQGQLWSEYITTNDYMEYMMFPRVCALSEVVWSDDKHQNYQAFLKRLEKHLIRLKHLNVKYRIPDVFRKKSP